VTLGGFLIRIFCCHRRVNSSPNPRRLWFNILYWLLCAIKIKLFTYLHTYKTSNFWGRSILYAWRKQQVRLRQKRWLHSFRSRLPEDDWLRVLDWQSGFQIMLLYWCLNNTTLHQYKVRTDDLCDLCQVREDMCHLLTWLGLILSNWSNGYRRLDEMLSRTRHWVQQRFVLCVSQLTTTS
jgi:hypothetical protein